jgi:hypothetical protein
MAHGVVQHDVMAWSAFGDAREGGMRSRVLWDERMERASIARDLHMYPSWWRCARKIKRSRMWCMCERRDVCVLSLIGVYPCISERQQTRKSACAAPGTCSLLGETLHLCGVNTQTLSPSLGRDRCVVTLLGGRSEKRSAECAESERPARSQKEVSPPSDHCASHE